MRNLKKVQYWIRSFEFWSDAAKADLQYNDFAEYKESQDNALFALVEAMELTGDLSETDDAMRWVRGELRVFKLRRARLAKIVAEFPPVDLDLLQETVDTLLSLQKPTNRG